MLTTMPITQARINLGAVVQSVESGDSQVILERAGNPVAAIVNIEMLENMFDGLEIAYAKKTAKDFVNWSDIKSNYGI